MPDLSGRSDADHASPLYERTRDLPNALPGDDRWGLDMEDPASELAALEDSALEGTFGNIRELVAVLRKHIEDPDGHKLGDFAAALGALRGEVAIMGEQVEALVSRTGEAQSDKN